jgi:hypothetical protein
LQLAEVGFKKSKNIIRDWIVEFSCTRTSIRVEDIPGRESCSLARNSRAMTQYLTLCDADLESA